MSIKNKKHSTRLYSPGIYSLGHACNENIVFSELGSNWVIMDHIINGREKRNKFSLERKNDSQINRWPLWPDCIVYIHQIGLVNFWTIKKKRSQRTTVSESIQALIYLTFNSILLCFLSFLFVCFCFHTETDYFDR